jgi:hypothetical protein
MLGSDLSRIARFAANLTDCYSAFLFLPAEVLSRLSMDTYGARGSTLVIGGHHSLSRSVILEAHVPQGHGLTGWVSKTKQPILVSLFDRDSKTLGVYRDEENIKSFIGVPFKIPSVTQNCGVITCDSLKPYTFSKLHVKLLEDLGEQVTSILSLHSELLELQSKQSTWGQFIKQAYVIINTLGPLSISVLRMHITNIPTLEITHGSERLEIIIDQLQRLIQQTIPPHFPLYRTATSDFVMVVDNMMSSFFENKIGALCDHLKSKGTSIEYEFSKVSPTKNTLHLTIEDFIAQSARDFRGEIRYERSGT